MARFVGRTDALSALFAAYTAVTGGAGTGRRRAGLVFVTGPAGIGKTALLARLTAEVAGAGATVAWGTCWDADQTPALWPWTQVLRSLLDDQPALRAAPELAAIVPDLPPLEAAEVADGRLRVFDAVARLLGQAAPVVVILDDLHWADPSTLELLRFVAGQSHPGGLLLVGAYRPDELGDRLVAALAGLSTAADRVPRGSLVLLYAGG